MLLTSVEYALSQAPSEVGRMRREGRPSMLCQRGIFAGAMHESGGIGEETTAIVVEGSQEIERDWKNESEVEENAKESEQTGHGWWWTRRCHRLLLNMGGR